MRARLTLLLLLEIAVLAFLVVQLIGAPVTDPATIGTSESRPPAASAAAPTPSAEITAAKETPRETTPPETTRTELATQLDPDDPVGILLNGKVRWHDGSPAVATVSARSGQRRRSNTSAEDGTFAITGLQPGEWSFGIRADGMREQTFQHTLTVAPTQSHDFVLGKSITLRVLIVTPNGKDARALSGSVVAAAGTSTSSVNANGCRSRSR